MKRIYVGNLAPGTDEIVLQRLFEQYGRVTRAGIICNHETGQSRGFGFIVMKNDRHGNEAIRQLNGCSVRGEKILVLEAFPPVADQNGSMPRDYLQDALDRFRM
jgi:RNA recognition motif-containing protein